MSSHFKHLTVALAAAAACAGPSDEGFDELGEAVVSSGHAGGRATPGKHVHRFTVDGLEREVIVYVPRRAPATPPAVLMLHGTSGDGERFFNISGWREKADEEGLVAVFPSALTYCLKEDENHDGDFDDAGERKVTTKWAAGNLGSAVMPLCTAEELAELPPGQRAAADHPLADDIAYIDVILTGLTTRYGVHPRRIHASGFSNGAEMTSRLALERSDRFAAIAAAAGALNLPAAPAARPIPFVYSVGELDDRYTTPLGVKALPLDESLLALPGVEQRLVTPMLTTLQLGPAFSFRNQAIFGVPVAEFRWTESTVEAPNWYRVLVVSGLGHNYPNGTNHPVVMADVLWEHFRQHAR